MNQLLATFALVADESLRQLEDFRHLEPSEVATVRRATDFASHLMSYMATEVLKSLSPRVGYVPITDLFQELVNCKGKALLFLYCVLIVYIVYFLFRRGRLPCHQGRE